MNRTAAFLTSLALAALVPGCASSSPDPSPPPAAAQAPAPAAVQPSTEPPAEAAPDGQGHFTEEQASRGRGAFRASCAECHYSSEFRGTQFQFSWRRRSVADLYTEIVRNMPEDAPGSLDPQVYVDIVAYILQLNGFQAGSAELPPDEAVLERYGMAAPGTS